MDLRPPYSIVIWFEHPAGCSDQPPACPAKPSGHGVIEIPFIEGMAAQDAPHGEITALQRAIFFDGLQGILGARGIKPAARRMPQILPVKPDRAEHNRLDCGGDRFDHLLSPAFFVSR